MYAKTPIVELFHHRWHNYHCSLYFDCFPLMDNLCVLPLKTDIY